MNLAQWVRRRVGDVLGAARLRPALFAICALAPPVLVGAVSIATPARYGASAALRLALPALDRESVRLLRIPPDATPTANALPDSPAAGREARRAVLNRAAAAAGVPTAALEGAIEVGEAEPTNGGPATAATQGRLMVFARADDPKSASKFANAYAQAYVSIRRELVGLRAREAREQARILVAPSRGGPETDREVRQLRLIPLLENINVSVHRLAPSPSAAISSPVRNAAAAIVFGLWLAVAATMLGRERRPVRLGP